MKLAFCLFKYFPFGGLQRDFLRIAQACVQRGHTVDVYTSSWEGEREPGLNIEILPVSGCQNHTRSRSFAKLMQQRLLSQQYDLVIGFNKMPGLHVYYAADVCYQTRIKQQRPFWYRWMPRYRQYLRDERAVFFPQTKATILTLSNAQREEYSRCYQVPLHYFHLLPPGISRDRIAPPNSAALRQELRKTLHIGEQQQALLMVGSGFKTKGLARVLEGMAALPTDVLLNTQLWVVGQDNSAPFLKQARQWGIEAQVTFLGGRHDVAQFFLAADLLVHPAFHENTGTVLLEAVVAGLPILTVDVCGYASYVHEADAGVVLPSPFDQNNFNHALQNMLSSTSRERWKQNGLAYAKHADIYSLPDKAAAIIEAIKHVHSS